MNRRNRPARDADGRRNVVIVGAAGKTGANPKSFQNVKGYVRGFDVKTGKRLWIFHTIPQQGEFGIETWEKESWVYTGQHRRVGPDLDR